MFAPPAFQAQICTKRRPPKLAELGRAGQACEETKQNKKKGRKGWYWGAAGRLRDYPRARTTPQIYDHRSATSKVLERPLPGRATTDCRYHREVRVPRAAAARCGAGLPAAPLRPAGGSTPRRPHVAPRAVPEAGREILPRSAGFAGWQVEDWPEELNILK